MTTPFRMSLAFIVAPNVVVRPTERPGQGAKIAAPPHRSQGGTSLALHGPSEVDEARLAKSRLDQARCRARGRRRSGGWCGRPCSWQEFLVRYVAVVPPRP